MNQRLGKRHLPPLNDVVTDLGEGNNLIQLVEILAEKPCTAKLHANPRFKAQKLENVSHGLQFCWDCGVTVALKPSPENLIDGDQPAVLGLIWALVGLSFLSFAPTLLVLPFEHLKKRVGSGDCGFTYAMQVYPHHSGYRVYLGMPTRPYLASKH